MTLDDKMLQVVARRFPGEDPYKVLMQLCRDTFTSGPGYKFLCLLNEAVPPMLPSVREGEDNNLASVGLREGHREVSAMIYRLSGRKPDNTLDPQANAPTKETSVRRGRSRKP